jgi:DNA-binding MarR family transcriptional regulator
MEASANHALESADLGVQLRAAVGRLHRRFRSERPEGALGDKALEVLTYLHKHGPQTLTALSDSDRVSPASMSQIVNRLAAAGYVLRAGDPEDRRKVLFTTTPQGAALAEAATSRRNAWLDSHLNALGDEDRQALARASALLIEIADS